MEKEICIHNSDHSCFVLDYNRNNNFLVKKNFQVASI